MHHGDSFPRNNTGASMVMTSKNPEPYISIAAQALVQDNCRVHCGMVRKENKIKKWQDRYLVLHKGCLYYYKDSNDKKAQGEFSLSGYRLSKAPEKTKYQWTFKLTHIQPEKRAYYFAAHSEKELDEWMNKIQEDIFEYCEIRRPPGRQEENNSSSEESDEKYDYPIVDDEDMIKLKEKIIGQSTTGLNLSSASEPTYSPAEEIFQPTTRPSSKPISLTPWPHVFAELPSSKLGVSPPLQRRVDISKIIGKELHSNVNLQSSQGARDISRFPRNLPPQVPERKKRNDNTSGSPEASPRPKPLPKPRKTAASVTSTSSMDSSSLEEMYLELNNNSEDPEPKLSTLQRNRPDGDSFKNRDNYELETSTESSYLPPSAIRLDYTKTEAIPLLIGYDGCYMIHSSSKGDLNQALSVCLGDKVKHFLIFYNKKEQYSLDPEGPFFPSMVSMLQHYYEKPLPNQVSLAFLRVPYK